MSDEPLRIYTIEGKLEDGIVQRLIKQMKEDGVDDDTIQHIIENQLFPKLAEQIIDNPEMFSTRMVNTDLDSKGYLVQCHKCGRQAKLPTPPPEGFIVTCPKCLTTL